MRAKVSPDWFSQEEEEEEDVGDDEDDGDDHVHYK